MSDQYVPILTEVQPLNAYNSYTFTGDTFENVYDLQLLPWFTILPSEEAFAPERLFESEGFSIEANFKVVDGVINFHTVVCTVRVTKVITSGSYVLYATSQYGGSVFSVTFNVDFSSAVIEGVYPIKNNIAVTLNGENGYSSTPTTTYLFNSTVNYTLIVYDLIEVQSFETQPSHTLGTERVLPLGFSLDTTSPGTIAVQTTTVKDSKYILYAGFVLGDGIPVLNLTVTGSLYFPGLTEAVVLSQTNSYTYSGVGFTNPNGINTLPYLTLVQSTTSYNSTLINTIVPGFNVEASFSPGSINTVNVKVNLTSLVNPGTYVLYASVYNINVAYSVLTLHVVFPDPLQLVFPFSAADIAATLNDSNGYVINEKRTFFYNGNNYPALLFDLLPADTAYVFTERDISNPYAPRLPPYFVVRSTNEGYVNINITGVIAPGSYILYAASDSKRQGIPVLTLTVQPSSTFVPVLESIELALSNRFAFTGNVVTLNNVDYADVLLCLLPSSEYYTINNASNISDGFTLTSQTSNAVIEISLTKVGYAQSDTYTLYATNTKAQQTAVKVSSIALNYTNINDDEQLVFPLLTESKTLNDANNYSFEGTVFLYNGAASYSTILFDLLPAGTSYTFTTRDQAHPYAALLPQGFTLSSNDLGYVDISYSGVITPAEYVLYAASDSKQEGIPVLYLTVSATALYIPLLDTVELKESNDYSFSGDILTYNGDNVSGTFIALLPSNETYSSAKKTTVTSGFSLTVHLGQTIDIDLKLVSAVAQGSYDLYVSNESSSNIVVNALRVNVTYPDPEQLVFPLSMDTITATINDANNYHFQGTTFLYNGGSEPILFDLLPAGSPYTYTARDPSGPYAAILPSGFSLTSNSPGYVDISYSGVITPAVYVLYAASDSKQEGIPVLYLTVSATTLYIPLLDTVELKESNSYSFSGDILTYSGGNSNIYIALLALDETYTFAKKTTVTTGFTLTSTLVGSALHIQVKLTSAISGGAYLLYITNASKPNIIVDALTVVVLYPDPEQLVFPLSTDTITTTINDANNYHFQGTTFLYNGSELYSTVLFDLLPTGSPYTFTARDTSAPILPQGFSLTSVTPGYIDIVHSGVLAAGSYILYAASNEKQQGIPVLYLTVSPSSVYTPLLDTIELNKTNGFSFSGSVLAYNGGNANGTYMALLPSNETYVTENNTKITAGFSLSVQYGSTIALDLYLQNIVPSGVYFLYAVNRDKQQISVRVSSVIVNNAGIDDLTQFVIPFGTDLITKTLSESNGFRFQGKTFLYNSSEDYSTVLFDLIPAGTPFTLQSRQETTPYAKIVPSGFTLVTTTTPGYIDVSYTGTVLAGDYVLYVSLYDQTIGVPILYITVKSSFYSPLINTVQFLTFENDFTFVDTVATFNGYNYTGTLLTLLPEGDPYIYDSRPYPYVPSSPTDLSVLFLPTYEVVHVSITLQRIVPERSTYILYATSDSSPNRACPLLTISVKYTLPLLKTVILSTSNSYSYTLPGLKLLDQFRIFEQSVVVNDVTFRNGSEVNDIYYKPDRAGIKVYTTNSSITTTNDVILYAKHDSINRGSPFPIASISVIPTNLQTSSVAFHQPIQRVDGTEIDSVHVVYTGPVPWSTLQFSVQRSEMARSEVQGLFDVGIKRICIPGSASGELVVINSLATVAGEYTVWARENENYQAVPVLEIYYSTYLQKTQQSLFTLSQRNNYTEPSFTSYIGTWYTQIDLWFCIIPAEATYSPDYSEWGWDGPALDVIRGRSGLKARLVYPTTEVLQWGPVFPARDTENKIIPKSGEYILYGTYPDSPFKGGVEIARFVLAPDSSGVANVTNYTMYFVHDVYGDVRFISSYNFSYFSTIALAAGDITIDRQTTNIMYQIPDAVRLDVKIKNPEYLPVDLRFYYSLQCKTSTDTVWYEISSNRNRQSYQLDYIVSLFSSFPWPERDAYTTFASLQDAPLLEYRLCLQNAILITMNKAPFATSNVLMASSWRDAESHVQYVDITRNETIIRRAVPDAGEFDNQTYYRSVLLSTDVTVTDDLEYGTCPERKYLTFSRIRI